jgi:hypothetical protein
MVKGQNTMASAVTQDTVTMKLAVSGFGTVYAVVEFKAKTNC